VNGASNIDIIDSDPKAKQLRAGIPRHVRSFTCRGSTHLKNLIGGPEYTDDFYYVDHCTNLTSLLGSPKIVGGIFSVKHCTSLTSLENGPRDVHILDVEFSSIANLKGGPTKVYALWLHNSGIESLEGAPQEVIHLDITSCKNLKNMKGGPRSTHGIKAYNSGLTSFEGAPKTIYASIDASDCTELVSLHGLPDVIHGSLIIPNCKKLVSLDGGPVSVLGDINLSNTGISSLEGIGTKVFMSVSGELILHNLTIKSHALGLLMIKGLARGKVIADFPGLEIILDHMHEERSPDSLIECQHKLIEAGFEDLAQL